MPQMPTSKYIFPKIFGGLQHRSPTLSIFLKTKTTLANHIYTFVDVLFYHISSFVFCTYPFHVFRILSWFIVFHGVCHLQFCSSLERSLKSWEPCSKATLLLSASSATSGQSQSGRTMRRAHSHTTRCKISSPKGFGKATLLAQAAFSISWADLLQEWVLQWSINEVFDEIVWGVVPATWVLLHCGKLW